MITERQLYDKYEKWLVPGMFWGFECGDGWYDLIDRTLAKAIDWYKENHPEDLEIGEDGFTEFIIMQIKEKYGDLRIYIGASYDEVFDMLEDALKESITICEVCGNKGETKEKNGWYKTVCEEHWNEWNNR
jgi:hypothetical protein